MNRKLNIALVVDAIEIGGVETYLFCLQRYFEDNGHRATLVACSRKGDWWDLAQSLGVRCVNVPRSRIFSRVNHAKKVGQFLVDQFFDCVLLNHTRYGQASIGMLPQHVIAIPIIHNDHESIYALACSNSMAWNIAVGVSPKVTDTATRLFPGNQITTISNGVRVPPVAMINKREGLQGTLKMLFVGRVVHDQKGVLYLPKIVGGCLAKNMDVVLTIVGEGDSLNELKKVIDRSGLSDRVRTVGVLSPDHVYEQLLEYNVLLMPSKCEGFGLVAVEAQACGCVPIASRLPGITDQTIDHGRTGLLADVGDIDGFVACIEKIYKDPLLWQTLSNNGIARVRRIFSSEAMGEAYLHLIHDALQGKYPLQRERKEMPPVDLSFFSWRDYIPYLTLR